MPDRYNEYVHRQNIENFTRQLATETDPEKRRLLLELLKAEQGRRLPLPSPQKPSD